MKQNVRNKLLLFATIDTVEIKSFRQLQYWVFVLQSMALEDVIGGFSYHFDTDPFGPFCHELLNDYRFVHKKGFLGHDAGKMQLSETGCEMLVRAENDDECKSLILWLRKQRANIRMEELDDAVRKVYEARKLTLYTKEQVDALRKEKERERKRMLRRERLEPVFAFVALFVVSSLILAFLLGVSLLGDHFRPSPSQAVHDATIRPTPMPDTSAEDAAMIYGAMIPSLFP